jgi:hypothetical protein
MKIITTGQTFLLNYKLSRFLKQPGEFARIFLPLDASSNKNPKYYEILNYRVSN